MVQRRRATLDSTPVRLFAARDTGPARTRRLRDVLPAAAWERREAVPQVAAQPTTDTEATTAIPLIRAGAAITLSNLEGKGCGRLEGEPVNFRRRHPQPGVWASLRCRD